VRNKPKEGSRATVSRDEDKEVCAKTGHRIFGSRKKALKALASYQGSQGKYGDQSRITGARPKSAARCAHCGGWHWSKR
jgi:hypothetical protein